MMLPNDAITIQNGVERSMKGGIIMARRGPADRKTHNSHMVETDARLALIHDWLSRELRLPVKRLEPASADASFRRYFRAYIGALTYVVMAAPPEKEAVQPYLKVSALLESMPGVGKVRAKQIMERLGIAESRRVRGLGANQRSALETEFGGEL